MTAPTSSTRRRVRRAVHATALPAEPPEWVQLVPAGRFTGRDGRGPYVLDDAATVARRSMQRTDGQPLPIDYDHQLVHTEENGAGAPAAAWITELAARADGLWGRVEWTPDGADQVRNRAYRYLSPVFQHTEDGHVTRLLFAGLTNKPNLTLTAISARRDIRTGERASRRDERRPNAPGGAPTAMTTNKKDADDPVLLTRIATAAGLKADASADDVLARIATHATAAATLEQLRTKVGAAAAADVDGLVTAAHAQVKPTTTTPDPKEFVSAHAHAELRTEFDTFRATAAKKEADRAVGAAIAAGKLAPAQRDWAIAQHSANPAEFEQFLGRQPVNESLADSAGLNGAPAAGANADDPQELAHAAKSYQADQARNGRTVSMSEAVRHVEKTKGAAKK